MVEQVGLTNPVLYIRQFAPAVGIMMISLQQKVLLVIQTIALIAILGFLNLHLKYHPLLQILLQIQLKDVFPLR